MQLRSATKVAIKQSPGKGWGCFATKDIYEGEIIEECHLLEIPSESIDHNNGLFLDYRFNYPSSTGGKQVIPFGNGCIYNHSDKPNAFWQDHPRLKAFQFVAKTDIKEGEEICTYYGGDNYWENRIHITKI